MLMRVSVSPKPSMAIPGFQIDIHTLRAAGTKVIVVGHPVKARAAVDDVVAAHTAKILESVVADIAAD